MITDSTPSSQNLLVSPLSSTKPAWEIKLLYDGACPLCLREVNFLQKRDAGRGLVEFVDITDLDYAPAEHGGIDFETAMGCIHAILADGTIMVGVPVLRKVYEVLGIGWVYGITQFPAVGSIADFIYDLWANWRLKLTGRADLATLVAQRQEQLAACTSERCQFPEV